MADPQIDAHAKPPESLKAIYRKYQKLPLHALETDQDLVDLSRDNAKTLNHNMKVVHTISFPGPMAQSLGLLSPTSPDFCSVKVFEHPAFPGLQLLPSLLPREVQWRMLCRLLHRDLADSRHKTNIHTHYRVPYELSIPKAADGSGYPDEALQGKSRVSFFNSGPNCPTLFDSINPAMHQPLTLEQFLRRKLRWLTLGNQYDWTQKVYPVVVPPALPEDIGSLIHEMFPDMRPEAAIVNVYSPGDTLSLHRDVSEESSQGLVSISLGCDGIFIVGTDATTNAEPHRLAIRLRSGDAVYMSGPSRYAWHAVPRIIPDTCPDWLKPWPASLKMPELEGHVSVHSTSYEAWRGWMATKRINLNVRQLHV